MDEKRIDEFKQPDAKQDVGLEPKPVDRVIIKDGKVCIQGDKRLIPPEMWKKWGDAYLERFGVTRKMLEDIEKRVAPSEQTNATTQKNTAVPQASVEQDKGIIKISTDEQAFVEMARLDEEQIVAELEGRILDKYVFEIQRKDKIEHCLTYAGIKTIIQKMGGVSITDVLLDETPTTYRAKAIVVDKKRDIQVIGVAEQSKFMITKNGREDDTFALQKCVSKAIRNAYRLIIPEFIATEIIKEWIKQKTTNYQ